MLLVAAIMAVMMSMGPALAANNGGTGGGPLGGAGGSGGQVVKHKKFDRYHHDVCWDKWNGKWYSYYC